MHESKAWKQKHAHYLCKSSSDNKDNITHPLLRWMCCYHNETDDRTVHLKKQANWTLSQYKDYLCIGISVVKIRRSWNHLMFVMGTPILVRKHLYIQTPPSSQLIVLVAVRYRSMFSYSPRGFHWQWIGNCISSVWCWCNYLIALVVFDSFISNELVYLYSAWKGVRFSLS